MKKVLALLLALVMCLSLAACGGKEDDKTPSSSNTPPSSNQQEQNTPDPGTSEPDETPSTPDDGNKAAPTAEWPTANYITSAMKWSGSGKVLNCQENTYTGIEDKTKTYNGVTVYIDEATIEEMGTYIEAIKADGFEFKGLTETATEPALEFTEQAFTGITQYSWRGETSDGRFIEIYLYELPQDTKMLDSSMNTIEYQYMLSIKMTETD